MNFYEEAGVAALLAGMVRAHEILGKEIDVMRERIRQLQDGQPLRIDPLESARLVTVVPKRRGRAKGDPFREAKAEGAKGAWAKLTAEERSAEMKRRMAVARKRKAKAEKRPSPQASYWARMTPEERSTEMARRVAVHQKKLRAEVRLQRINGEATQ